MSWCGDFDGVPVYQRSLAVLGRQRAGAVAGGSASMGIDPTNRPDTASISGTPGTDRRRLARHSAGLFPLGKVDLQQLLERFDLG